MSGLIVTLGSQEFNGPGSPWSMDITSGWWDGPEMDVDLLPTIGEGSALGRVMLRHRTLVCAGLVVTPTPEDHAQAHLDIEGLVPVYSTTPLVVDEVTGARQLEVRASGPPMVRCHGRAIEFQLTLVATDPHKQPVEES